MSTPSYRFRVHPERLAIARLDPSAALPEWARGAFVTSSRTASELSLVCAQRHVPPDVQQERERIAIGLEGTIPMTTVGLLAALCTTLAQAKVPVFAISTYDTDYLLVTAANFTRARSALEAAGFPVLGDPPA